MSSFSLFITNLAWSVLGKTCVQVLLFAISILTARYLGGERLGVYASLLVIPAFVRLLNSFGLETLLNKKLPELKVQDPSEKQARFLLIRLLGIRFLSSIVFCALIYFSLPWYLEFVHMPDLLVYRPAIIFYFLMITVNSLLSTLFMTLLKYRIISVVETLSAFFNLLFLIVFIYMDLGVMGVLYAYILATGINILIYLILAKKSVEGETEPAPRGDMGRLAGTSYVIGLFSFGLMAPSDVFLMNYFQVETARVGYYHLVTGLGGMLAFALAGIGPLALAIFSETHARESVAGLSRSWCEIVGAAAFVTCPLYVFAFFNAESLMTFVFGDPFAAAGGALAFYLVFIGTSTILGTDFSTSALFVLHRRNLALRSTIEASLMNIGLNLILIPRYQELGALAATGCAMVYMIVRQLLALQKDIGIRAVFPFIGKCLLFSLAAAVPMEIFSRAVGDHLILNAGGYLVLFLLVLAWFKPLSADHQGLFAKIHPRLASGVRWFVR